MLMIWNIKPLCGKIKDMIHLDSMLKFGVLLGCVLIFLVVLMACAQPKLNPMDYRQAMRDTVIKMSRHMKDHYGKGFVIIPNNGEELWTENGLVTGNVDQHYVDAVDGMMIESIFFIHNYGVKDEPLRIDRTQKREWTDQFIKYLDFVAGLGKMPIAIDFTARKDRVASLNQIYHQDDRYFLSLATDHATYGHVPKNQDPLAPYQVNDRDITQLSEAKNFVYVIGPDWPGITKETYLQALLNTNYDVMGIAPIFWSEFLTKEEVAQLKVKANGGKRLLIAYVSLGQVEPWAPYWKKQWLSKKHRPPFLTGQKNSWGSYEIKYWHKSWHEVLIGENGYLDHVAQLGFDGVVLDVVDAYEIWEGMLD